MSAAGIVVVYSLMSGCMGYLGGNGDVAWLDESVSPSFGLLSYGISSPP